MHLLWNRVSIYMRVRHTSYEESTQPHGCLVALGPTLATAPEISSLLRLPYPRVIEEAHHPAKKVTPTDQYLTSGQVSTLKHPNHTIPVPPVVPE